MSLDGRERAVTLTERGHHLLNAHRRDRDDARDQAFHAGINRPRELTHDKALYRACLRAEERLREQGADVRRVVLEHDLKREYQCFLQERNRARPESDGRPDRDPREIEELAHEHGHDDQKALSGFVGMVSLPFASWNQIGEWLRRVEFFRRAA